MKTRLFAAAAIIGLLNSALPIGMAQAAPNPTPATSSSSTRSPESLRFLPQTSQSPQPLAADIITFSEFPHGTHIADQYQDKGILVGGDDPFITSDGANPTSPVLSGSPLFQGSIHLKVVDPVTGQPATAYGFALDVGYIDSPNSVEVASYDINGRRLGTAMANGYGINHIDVSLRGVTNIWIRSVSDEPAGFAIDNVALKFEPEGITPTRMASLGDSYSSGEGLLESPKRAASPITYDCGTNLHKGDYTENTTVRYYGVWVRGWDCDIPTGSRNRPADYESRKSVEYFNLCHRTGLAYPNRIREALGISARQALFVACSGARAKNVGLIDTKVAQYGTTSPYGVAGGRTQSEDLADFAGQGLPDFITIGLGGNDAGFSEIITKCMLKDCLNEPGFQSNVIATIDWSMYPKLVTTLSELRRLYPTATLAVFGYPKVLDNDLSCLGIHLKGGAWDIGPAERKWTNEVLLPAVNQAVGDAAGLAGATYIDVSEVTAGHEVCTKDPWINGLRNGEEGRYGLPIGSESFHPNQKAHAAIAQFFMDHYTDGQGRLLFSNPTPSSIIPHPQNPPRVIVGGVSQPQLQTPCGQRCVTPNVCNAQCLLQISGSGYGANMTLRVTAHSDPVDLGTVITDENGEFSAELSVPDGGLPPGDHELELSGVGSDGIEYQAFQPFTVLEPFTISAAQAVAQDPRTATVRWISSYPSTSQVELSAPGQETRTEAVGELEGDHEVTLSGLTPGVRYRVVIAGATLAGNRATAELSLVQPEEVRPTPIGTPQPSPTQAGSPPSARVKVKAVDRKRKLRVDINPNRGKRHWTFSVQRKAASGRWHTIKGIYRTQGKAEKRTLDLGRGTYRVLLKPQYGYTGVTSRPVKLNR